MPVTYEDCGSHNYSEAGGLMRFLTVLVLDEKGNILEYKKLDYENWFCSFKFAKENNWV
jgi:hypothetical protein